MHPRDTPMGEDPDTVRGYTTPEPQSLPNQPMTHYGTEIISGLRNTGKTDKT